MTNEELDAHIGSDDFKARAAAVLARQNAGEDLSHAEIAEAMGVPLAFVQDSLAVTARSTMTGEQFLQWAADQMAGYQRSEGFEAGLVVLEQFLAEGRKVTLREMSDMLAIPYWLCELGALRAYAHRLGHVVVPENHTVQ